MKLGGKSKDVDSFVDQLKSEGEHVSNEAPATRSNLSSGKTSSKAPPSAPAVKMESVHAKIEEKMTVVARRDGGLDNMELSGHLTLRITDEAFGRIKLQLKPATNNMVQTQTHPNIDKELMKRRSQIGLKNPAKPFPLNTDVGVLKWRLQTTDESNIPLSSMKIIFPIVRSFKANLDFFSVNCWPSDNGQGGCDVNIEYELEQDQLELQDVVITIPIP